MRGHPANPAKARCFPNKAENIALAGFKGASPPYKIEIN